MKRCRLIYKSVSESDVVSNEEIRELVEQAAAANRQRRITGLLVLTGNRFLQVLEGPYREVNRLFNAIVRDPRHRDVELISFEPLESPCFADWDMRLADLYDLPAGPRDVLAAKYAHKNGEIAIPDHLPEIYAFLLDARAICLSTPWQHGVDDTGASRSSS